MGADRGDGPEIRVTRRRALAAAAWAAAAVLLPAGRGGLAWGASGLAPRRAATYRTLVHVLGQGPDPRFRHRRPAAAARDFARWYAGQDASVRAHADAVLDALAAGFTPRYARLVQAAAPQDAAVVATAVALAAVACDPPPDVDERPTVPALGVPA